VGKKIGRLILRSSRIDDLHFCSCVIRLIFFLLMLLFSKFFLDSFKHSATIRTDNQKADSRIDMQSHTGKRPQVAQRRIGVRNTGHGY